MSGPFRFVVTVIWIAIGLSTIGTLRECTGVMAHEAAYAHQHQVISLGWWNRKLMGKSLQESVQKK